MPFLYCYTARANLEVQYWILIVDVLVFFLKLEEVQSVTLKYWISSMCNRDALHQVTEVLFFIPRLVKTVCQELMKFAKCFSFLHLLRWPYVVFLYYWLHFPMLKDNYAISDIKLTWSWWCITLLYIVRFDFLKS